MSSGISISSCPWIETYIYDFQYFCWFCELWYYIFVSLVCANILFRGILLFIDDLIVSLDKSLVLKFIYSISWGNEISYFMIGPLMKKLSFSSFPIYTHPYSLAQFLPCGAKIENENRIWPFFRIWLYYYLIHYNNWLHGINGNSGSIIYIENV